jgi:hypothetical protein
MGMLRPSGVLTVVKDSGDPRSLCCLVEFDDAHEQILFPALPRTWLVNWDRPACSFTGTMLNCPAAAAISLQSHIGSEQCC